jgi:hypothetical protein
MDEESLVQAQRWAGEVAIHVLDWTWRAFDQLAAEHLSQVDLQRPLEQLERDLTSKHFIQINRIWAKETEGFSSLTPHHEFPENETRPPAPGKPPAYDLAFVWCENQRVAWPLEAKVVQAPGALANYMGDVQKFLSATAAPLVGEGGQIAYLLRGTATEFFGELASRLNQRVEEVAPFQNRPHRASHHRRVFAPDLRLHHLVMHLREHNVP